MSDTDMTKRAPAISPIKKFNIVMGERKLVSPLTAVIRFTRKELTPLERKIMSMSNLISSCFNNCWGLKIWLDNPVHRRINRAIIGDEAPTNDSPASYSEVGSLVPRMM